MKTTLFTLLLVPLMSVGQLIHPTKVPPVNADGPTPQQALDEFWQYHTLATSPSYSVWHSNHYIRDEFGLTWPKTMQVWDEAPSNDAMGYDPLTRFTADAVIGYARACRTETLLSRLLAYQQYAMGGAEYLLCLQNKNNDGGLPPVPVPSTYFAGQSDVFNTSVSIIAWLEMYMTFGTPQYLDAALWAADWQMRHPTYPYGNLCRTCDCPPLPPGHPQVSSPCLYYSNANHMGLQLWSLSLVYSVTGSQKYLDRCLQLAEEIIAWQDYVDVRNQWSPGSIPDGGWYWYDYSANPVPPGSHAPPPNGGFNQNRLMGYHTFIIRGLLNLLDVVGQQSLAGVTTLRNQVSFVAFRTKLLSSIIKAFNYMADNQEDCQNCSYNWQYRGGLRHFKDNLEWNSNGSFSTNITTSSDGLDALVDAREFLTRYATEINEPDAKRIRSLLSSVAENLLGRHSCVGWTFSFWAGAGMMPNWARYANFMMSIPPTSILQLRNSGFENMRTTWELWSWDGSGVEISTSAPRTGKKSLHIADASTTASKWASQIVTAKPSTEYTVTAWARILSGHQDLYFEFLDSRFSALKTSYVIVPANSGYTMAAKTETSPANTAYARVQLYSFWSGTSEGYWDDVQLAESVGGVFVRGDTTAVTSE